MKKCFATLLLLGLHVLVYAQAQQPNWPDDPELRKIAQEKLVFYRDELTVYKRPENAIEPLSWLLRHTPELGKFLYTDAIRVYYAKISQLTDTKLKEAYQDTLMTIFDNAIKYFDEEAVMLNYKGYYAYNFYYNKPEKMPELLKLYERIIELNGESTYPANLQYYLLTAINLKAQKKLTDAEVIDIYLKAKDIVAREMASTKDANAQKQCEEADKNLDAYFMQYVQLNCEQIESIFGSKFRTQPTKEVALQARDLLRTTKCYTSPLFLDVSTFLYKEEKNFANAYLIATLYEAKNNVNKAMEYLREAVQLANDNDERTKAYKELVVLTYRADMRPMCRTYALKLAEVSAQEAAFAYTVIGDLYLKSGSECSNGENPVEKKAFAIAAYNMYKKAGNTNKMNEARRYFPTKEEVFIEGMAGKNVTVNCWINETVTVPQITDL